MSKSKKNKSLKKENRKAISATLFTSITSQLVELGFDTKKINKDVKKTADKLAQKISKFTIKETSAPTTESSEAVEVKTVTIESAKQAKPKKSTKK
ncbi:hypothetical protein [Pedobacter namyangjuensis]|uniref:hypothetical protein n=1 Tax=Pedobacter namyangjuensis TaxID=600626 RepID=UPI000DE452A8|nr:hypothetical protein [Pedobacter namyangjuensis]